MIKVASVSFAVLALIVSAGCGKKDSPTGPSQGVGSQGGGSTQLFVSYIGFIGESFSATAPILCPTSACAVGSPAQTTLTQGIYNYAVADGATYVIHGTLRGLAVPFQNVRSALAFSLSLQPELLRLYGIRKSTVRMSLNGSPLPSTSIFNGPGCGHYLETLSPVQSLITTWSSSFTIVSYTTQPPAHLC